MMPPVLVNLFLLDARIDDGVKGRTTDKPGQFMPQDHEITGPFKIIAFDGEMAVLVHSDPDLDQAGEAILMVDCNRLFLRIADAQVDLGVVTQDVARIIGQYSKIVVTRFSEQCIAETLVIPVVLSKA
jgi:hypothetical protein